MRPRPPQPPAARAPSDLAVRVFVFGLLDGGTGFAWFAGVPVVAWHAAVMAMKLLIISTCLRRLKPLTPVGSLMLGSTALLISVQMFVAYWGFTPMLAALGFLIEFAVTLLLLAAAGAPGVAYTRYAAGAAVSVAASAALHMGMALTGHIGAQWGRYLYFNGSAFGLGEEIAAAGAVAALIGLPRWRAVAVIGLLIGDSMLLQGRASLLTEFACLLVVASFDARRRLTLTRFAFVLGIGVSVIALMVLFNADAPLVQAFRALMQVDNVHRGGGSGVSGRGDLWPIAINAFFTSPIWGHGLGYYDAIDFIGPHNIVLYGLGEYGLTAAPFLFAIVAGFLDKRRRSGFTFAALLATLPLLMFNDRFIDLNAYPFLIYVLLAAESPGAPAPRPVAAPSRAAPTRARPRARGLAA